MSNTYRTGTLERRSNGTWRYRAHIIDKAGNAHRPSKGGFPTKAAAREALNDFLGKTKPGEYLKPSEKPLQQYLDDWLVRREDNEAIRPATASSYRTKIKHIPVHYGSVRVCDLTANHLDELYAEYRQGRSASSVLNLHRIIRKALQDLVKKEELGSNVANAASPPSARAAKAPEFPIWDQSEAAAFLSWTEIPEYRRIAWHLALATGMRREDLAGLRWQDYRDGKLDLKNVRVQYVDRDGRKAIYEGASKTDKGRRVIGLDSTTVRALERWRAVQKAQSMKCGQGRPAYVLTNYRARLWNPEDLSQAWRKDVKRAVEAGVVSRPMRLHDARHWHATVSIQQGVNLRTLADRLGHATAAFTLSTYGHSDVEQDQRCADLIGEALGL